MDCTVRSSRTSSVLSVTRAARSFFVVGRWRAFQYEERSTDALNSRLIDSVNLEADWGKCQHLAPEGLPRTHCNRLRDTWTGVTAPFNQPDVSVEAQCRRATGIVGLMCSSSGYCRRPTTWTFRQPPPRRLVDPASPGFLLRPALVE